MSIRFHPHQLRLLDGARRATLATLAPDGRPRLVPCCFAPVDTPDGPAIVTPIDAKPKRVAGAHALARVRDIERDPRVTLLVDGWDEDWTRLWWLRVDGQAIIAWPGTSPEARDRAIVALRVRYPQYQEHPLEELPVIVIRPLRLTEWRGSAASALRQLSPGAAALAEP